MESPRSPLIVVMPAFNEEGCITDVCRAWLRALDAIPGASLVVVDDGSTDATGALLDRLAEAEPRLAVLHRPNGGHGAAVMTGYRAALEKGAARILQVDSDGQCDPDDLDALWSLRERSRFILARRRDRDDGFARLLVTVSLRALLFALFGVRIPDSNVPFRLMDARYLARLLTLPLGRPFAPNVLLSVAAAADGEDLLHAPVAHRRRSSGVPSIASLRLMRACLRSARELLAFRARLPAALRRLQRASP